jgi:hypothetical protein
LQIGLWRGPADIADELFSSPKSMINTVGLKLDEAAGIGEPDQWLRENAAGWQDQLVAQQQHVARSDGIALKENPRRSFQESL